jgi:hypothetical protein
MSHKSILSCFIFCLIVILSGCGDSSRPQDLPDLQPCTLTFKQNDQELSEAFVMLYPVNSGNTKCEIAGNTDAKGNVVLKTHGKFSGVPVGEYKIVVTKTEQVQNEQQTSDGKNKTPSPKVDIYYLIDKVYTDVSTTPLTINIKNGKNIPTFDVGRPIRKKVILATSKNF